jgi:hypothetical protein
MKMEVEKMLFEFEYCVNESALDYNFSELSKEEQTKFIKEAVKIIKDYFEV